MPTIFDYELVSALRQAGCPMCRVLAKDEVSWIDTFWREGKMDADLRRAFIDAGGFCGRHAWLLHDRVGHAGSGAPIADVYRSLAKHDLDWLEQLLEGLQRGGRRKPVHFRRRGGAPRVSPTRISSVRLRFSCRR